MAKRRFRRWLARLFLSATGWRAEGERPDARRYVLIAAPHTTNWDFPYLLAFAEHFACASRGSARRVSSGRRSVD